MQHATLRAPSFEDLNDLNGLMADAHFERQFKDMSPRVPSRYVSAEGLAQLAEAGAREFEKVTGHRLPHNLVRGQMTGSVGIVGPYGRRLPVEEANAEIQSFARFGGWLKAAATLPGVRRMIMRTQSPRGINSPYTYCVLWSVAAKFPSPGKLERTLWRTQYRARQILAAFGGDVKTPSWKDTINALGCNRTPRKAAVILAASTLGMDMEVWGPGSYPPRSVSYKEAREWLVKRHMTK